MFLVFTQVYEVYLVAQVCAISWRLKKYCFLSLDSSTMLFHNSTAQLAPRQMPFKYRVKEFLQNSCIVLLSSCSNLSKTKSWVTWCLSRVVLTHSIFPDSKKKKTNKLSHTVMVPWAQSYAWGETITPLSCTLFQLWCLQTKLWMASLIYCIYCDIHSNFRTMYWKHFSCMVIIALGSRKYSHVLLQFKIYQNIWRYGHK